MKEGVESTEDCALTGRSGIAPGSDRLPCHESPVVPGGACCGGLGFGRIGRYALALRHREEILGCIDGIGALILPATRASIAAGLESIVSLVCGAPTSEPTMGAGSSDHGGREGGVGEAPEAAFVPSDSFLAIPVGSAGVGEGKDSLEDSFVPVKSRRMMRTQRLDPDVHQRSGGAVYIEPKEGSRYKDLEELKRDVLKALEPLKKGLQLRKVVKSRAGGIIIETGRGEDRRRILGDPELRALKVKVREKPLRRPRIVIRRAPRMVEGRCLDATTLKECLKKQNFGGQVTVDTEIGLMYRKGPKEGEFCEQIVEVNPRLRALLIQTGRVYLGSHVCRIEDYDELTRCYKCHRFNHVAKYCKQKENSCGHCGQYGHCYIECKGIEDPPCCPNCSRAGKQEKEHRVFSRDCPVYLAALGRLRDMTDYGF